MGVYEYSIIALDGRLYRQDAAEALADVFDIAVNVCGLGGNEAADAFVASGLAEQFERCNPVYVAGRSGSELVDVLLPFAGEGGRVLPAERFGRSPDYWAGWVLACFQMDTGHPYRSIFERVSFEELRDMYRPLHEADERKAIEVLHRRWERPVETRLRFQREARGLSQSQLARRSGVSLRSIQMYEQRNKSINKAQAETLYRLALALNCAMEDLLER